MKKLITFIIIALSIMFAGFAFAAAQSGTGTVTLGSTSTTTFTTSNNVTVEYNAESTGLGYTATGVHASGTRKYGSSSGDAKIYYNTNTGATIPTAPSGTATADFSAWTAQ